MMTEKPLFIIFSGLPGVGKTSISRMLAEQLRATLVRVDSIEQSIMNSLIETDDVQDAGYLAGYLIASDNLSIGNSVIADSVNSLKITREAWRNCAQNIDCHVIDIEITCSDKDEHRKRVEKRKADILNHKIPNWNDVKKRDYGEWDTNRIIIDTAATNIETILSEVLSAIKRVIDKR